MPFIKLDSKDVYRVESDHIVYFSDITKGILQMLKFSSEKIMIYQKDIMQAIYDSKNITIYHHDLIIYHIEIDKCINPSSKDDFNHDLKTSLIEHCDNLEKDNRLIANHSNFEALCYIK